MNLRQFPRPTRSRTPSAQRRGRRCLLRPSAGVWFATLALLAAGAAVARDHADVSGVEDRVAPGRVCRSMLGQGLELSCGTYGFGDLRYVCPTAATGGSRCRRTQAVTVRNTGSSTVYVRSVHGPGPGVRRQTGQQMIRPGRSVTLRPLGEGFLFDITLRGTGSSPGTVTVTLVR